MGTGICISMSNPVISNNIIFNPSENFRGLENLYGQPQISYNDILVGLEAYHNCSPGIGDIQADPKFVNTDRGDFRLAENSPCIDAGDPDSIYNDVDGSRNDMGAFGGPDPINLSMTLQIFLSVGTSSVSGFPGDTVKVSVGVDNAAGIAQAQFAVEFNAELLTLLNVSKTILTKDFSIQSDISQPNKVKVELKNDREIPSGKGSIIDLFFIVNPNAQSEQATPLTLQSVAFVDGSGAPIELKEITHGVFVVNFMGSSEHVVYVDENNNGFEDGSRSYPYNTIYEGITHTDEGDTVVVAGGFYLEKLEINKGIFLKGAGAGVTTVEAGSDTEFEDYMIHLNTQQPCGISGFTITNKSYGFIMSVLLLNAPQAVVTKNKIVTEEIWPGLMVDWQDASGGILQENYIHGGGEGLCIKNSPDLLVKNNRFVSKDLGSAALYCENSQVKIIGNKFEVGGIVIGVRIIASSTVSIQNNIFESKTFGGSGIEIKESTGDVINNTIVTNDEGIHSISNASTLVMNNIVVGSQIGSGIYSQGGTVSTYNDIWNQRANYNGISPGEGDISANPLFADSAHSDFHLNPYSPCTDAGKPDAVYNDHDGSRNDMGAFGGPMADTSGFLGRKINVAFANSQIQEGDTLLIPVTATNIQAINDFEMQVKFNESQLSVLTVRQGELTQAFALTENKESPGIIQVNLSSPLDVRQNSGSICELLVQVKNNSDTTTVIRLENLLFRDQIENEYTAASVERCFNISSVKDEKTGSNILPEKITLQQNYPNPFNPVTTICYELPKSSFITIKIYNMLGQEIRILYDGVKHAGAHHAIWDAKDNHGIKMSSGLYFYRFSVE